MADYRTIHTKIWDDPWVRTLTPEGKVLWIYLFANRRGSVCGLYELPEWIMAAETGLRPAEIARLIRQFTNDGKIQYEDGVVWVKTMRRYQGNLGESVQKRIGKDIELVPDRPIKARYLAGDDRPPTPCLSPVTPRVHAGACARSDPNRTDTDTDTDGGGLSPPSLPAQLLLDSLKRLGKATNHLDLTYLEKAVAEYAYYAVPSEIDHCVAHFDGSGKSAKIKRWGATFYKWCIKAKEFDAEAHATQQEIEQEKVVARRYYTADEIKPLTENDKLKADVSREKALQDVANLNKTLSQRGDQING